MKTILLASLLFSSCFALSLFKPSTVRTRNVGASNNITCPPITTSCASAGSTCSLDCGFCINAFYACENTATNETAICACAVTLTNCMANAKDAACPSAVAYQQCMSEISNCSCGTPYTGTVTDYECDVTAYCASNSKCVSLKGVGAACNSSGECGDSSSSSPFAYEYSCINNVCQKAVLALPGDPCSQNSDCDFYADYSLGCVSGVCASQKVGDTCPQTITSDPVCGSGLYCDGENTCQMTKAIGSTCNGNDTSSTGTQCGSYAICDAVSNKCVEVYSQTSGQTCSDNSECAPGLYCSSKNNMCATMLPEVACNNDQDCYAINTDYSGCMCNGTKSVCFIDTAITPATHCVTEAIAFYQCVDNNNCVIDSLIPGGCIENNCQKEYSCYYNCAGPYFDVIGFDTCGLNVDNTCATPSFGTKNSVAWAVVATASAAAVLL